MTGDEFILSIDHRFPYFDETQWRPLVETGARLSPNCAFMVLHELCRPSTCKVTRQQLRAIYQYWRSCFAHPLVEVMSPVAEAMMAGDELAVSQAMATMRIVAQYPDEYNALGIAFYSCGEPTQEARALFDQVVAGWRGAQPHNAPDR
jgi:hypothetical protein